jgi:hypothetical protein
VGGHARFHEAALANSDVIVSTSSSGTDAGNITVAQGVSWSSSNALTLSADRSIAVNANITNTGGANVTLRADSGGTGVGTVAFAPRALISTSGAVSIYYNPSVNPAGGVVNALSYVNPAETFSGNVAGGASLTAYMLVNSVYDPPEHAEQFVRQLRIGEEHRCECDIDVEYKLWICANRQCNGKFLRKLQWAWSLDHRFDDKSSVRRYGRFVRRRRTRGSDTERVLDRRSRTGTLGHGRSRRLERGYYHK